MAADKTPEQQVTKEGINYWKLSGKVVKKNMKYSAKGNAFISLLVRIPAKNSKFTTTLFVKAFKETAEKLETSIAEGGIYWFSGYFSTNSVEKDGKKTYYEDRIISKYGEAVVDPEIPVQEKKSEEKTKDEVPF